MTAIKPLGVIAEKWKRNGAAAGPAYEQGIKNPRRPWMESTIAADQARKDGLAAADARDATVKGVRAAGDAKWKKKTQAVGASRLVQGINASESEFSTGFAPFREVIAGVTLPPRGPKGSPENLNRVSAITKALHDAKIGA